MTIDARTTLARLAQLMAYAVRADGRVSADELETLHQFLVRRYSESSRAEFFPLFRQALDDRPDIERIVADIHDGLPGYEQRLDVYAAIQTLLSATGMTAEESSGLGTIAALLDIDAADADLLASASRPVPSFRFPVNRERYLRLGAGPSAARAGARDLRLTAMHLGGRIAVASDAAAIAVAATSYHPSEIAFVNAGEFVSLPAATLTFADLSRLFDLSRRRVSRTVPLDIAGAHLASAGEAGRFPLEFRVSEAELLLVKRDPGAAVTLNGLPIETSAVLVPGDVLGFDAGDIRVSQLLDGLDQARWPLSRTADTPFRYTIADRPGDGTTQVVPDVGGPLSITIAEPADAAAGLVVDCASCDCRVPLMIGDVRLAPNGPLVISEKTTLRIGHHWFVIDPRLQRVDYSKRIVERFEAREVRYRFSNTTGLDGISFAARAGELVGIMGGSGAGKSTLLSVLLGVLKPHEGAVLLNGEPLDRQLRRARSILGYVPQDDLVLDNLTVEENLLYSGRIRLPDLPEARLRARVTQVLRDTGLLEKKDLRVGNPVSKVLSGGQRKRLNIGIELLADPELFFLDEPTSGLSSRDSKAIIGLLSQLTRRGKLVFVVIHQPGSDIYKRFDKLLILDKGGVLIWYGPALEAVGHFKDFLPHQCDFVECPACGSINPETMLDAIEQPGAGPAEGAPRKFDPEFWENAFLLKRPRDAGAAPPAVPLPSRSAIGARGRARAFAASIRRAFIDRARNRTNIVMSVAAPLMLGLVMAAMLRGPDQPYTYSGNGALGKFFFLSTIVFVFFGLMGGVNEVIRELALIRRERIAGFKAGQYVVAKTLAFLPFALLQVVIYTVLASLVLQFPYRAPPDSPLQPPMPFPWYFAIVVFLVGQAAFALGLLLSSFLKTQAAAFNWIPLIVIPQILFGGVFVPYADMPKLVNRVVPEYAELTFSRWAYEALLAGEKRFNPADRWNADAILALQAAVQARGETFDERALLDGPRRRWQSERGVALPPSRISTTVMQDTLLRRLRIGDRTDEVRLLEDAYQRRDRRTYTLKDNLPPATLARIEAILMSPETGWWASTFATQGVNEALESERQAANVPDPEAVSTLRQLVTDRNDYPAQIRLVGATVVPVTFWNTLALLAMMLACHVVSILRLRQAT